jgi:hypothetical protein
MRWRKLIAMCLLLAPLTGLADDQKGKEEKLPVTAKLVAKKDTYRLELDGKTPEEFRKLIAAGGKLPAPPAVHLELELHNTSDKEVKIWVKGDPVVLELDVKGPGAVSVIAQKAFTQEYRAPAATTLPPGRSYSYPITSLKYGFRGVEKHAYWTEPGEYTITATLTTAISPAPPGTKVQKGFGQVALTSNPLKVKVLGK